MPTLVLPQPGRADTRSVVRYLVGLARAQWRTLALGTLLGSVWMVSLALIPWALGHGIDAVGVTDTGALLRWSGVLLGLAAISALAGGLRHWMAVRNWLTAAFRVAGQVHDHALAAGPAVTRSKPTGEVVAIFTNDDMRIGGLYDVWARFAGALVTFVVIAVILLRDSVQIGLIVLLGGPVMLGSLALIVRPLQRRQARQREESGHLTTLGADTVAGLRVLRGIGGEDAFLRRYEEQSRRVRSVGWRVANLQAALDSMQVLLPGIFVLLVTWAGARAVVAGTLSAGQLVSLYGYAAFLTVPFWTVIEFVDRAVRAVIGARKVLDILRIEPDQVDPDQPLPRPSPEGDLVDPVSGARFESGRLTALVSAVPEESAAVIDRLGRLSPENVADPSPSATLGGIPLTQVATGDVRRTIVVSESHPHVFAGPLRDQVAPWGPVPEEALDEALYAASAADAVDALPDGLDGIVEERGRSFSGGQRQRLALTRALLADPPILALVEPTSAVDAHTEARVAIRLAGLRAGRTTVVATASSLVLSQCDEIVLLEHGVATDRGTHRELVGRSPAYRRIVRRGEEDA